MDRKVSKIDPSVAALLVILLVAAILRFWHYASFSLSNDELSAINRLRYDHFRDLVNKGFYVDGHPGGIQVFLWYWSKLFGLSAASLRLPFVIFGILSVWFGYLVTGRMFGKVAGLFTAASLSFLQFPLLYSQIARPYISGLLFSLMMTYFWLRIVFRKEDKESPKTGLALYAGYIVSVVLCMYDHYFCFLFALIAGITGLFLVKRKDLRWYVLSGIVAVILFLPHLRITLNHLTYQGVGLWLGKPGIDWPLHHIGFILNDSWYMVILFTFISILVNHKGSALPDEGVMLRLAFLFFLMPMTIGFLYSVFVNPVLQNPVLIFSFPFFIMLFFVSAGTRFGKVQQLLLAIFLAGGVLGTVAVDRYYSRQHFGEFRGIAETTLKWQQETGRDSLEKVVITNSPYYLDYYFERLGDSASYSMYQIAGKDDVDQFRDLLIHSDKPCFLYAWTKPESVKVVDMIRSVYPFILKSRHFGNLSAITLYCRSKGYDTDPAYAVKPLFARTIFNETGQEAGDPSIQKATGDEEKEKFSFPADENTEFCPGISLDLDKYSRSDAIGINASVRIKTDSIPTGALLVISVEKDRKTIAWTATPFEMIEKKGDWSRFFVSQDLQGADCRGSELKVYVWNKEKKRFMINRLELKVFEYAGRTPFMEDEEVFGQD